MTTGYDFHPEAESDLNDIWDYIAAESPRAADRMITDIHEVLENLTPFPYQGHQRPNLTSRPVCFIVVREYLIAYAPDEKPLWVIAVMHSKRHPRTMAAILRGRE